MGDHVGGLIHCLYEDDHDVGLHAGWLLCVVSYGIQISLIFWGMGVYRLQKCISGLDYKKPPSGIHTPSIVES